VLAFHDNGGLTECAFFTKDFTNIKNHQLTIIGIVNNFKIKT